MDKETVVAVKKIQLVSRVLLPLFYFTKFITPLVTLGLIIFTFTSPSSTGVHIYESGTIGGSLGDIKNGLLTVSDKFLFTGLVISLATFAMLAVIHSIDLLKQFKENEIFCTPAIISAKRIAQIFTIYVVLTSLPLLSIEDLRATQIDLLSNDYIVLGCLWIFVWVLQIGTSLHNENKMTI